MQYKNLVVALFWLLPVLVPAQKYIGLNSGICYGRFYDFVNNEQYQTQFEAGAGQSFSILYGTQLDSSEFSFETEYNLQCSGMIINNNTGNFSSYSNVDYTLHNLNLHLYYTFPLFGNRFSDFDCSPGVVIGYVMRTKAIGSGWRHVSETQYDSIGNPHQVIVLRHYIKDESNSQNITRLHFGMSFSLNYHLRFSQRIELKLSGRGICYLSNFTADSESYYTSMLVGQLNLGLLYSLSNGSD